MEGQGANTGGRARALGWLLVMAALAVLVLARLASPSGLAGRLPGLLLR